MFNPPIDSTTPFEDANPPKFRPPEEFALTAITLGDAPLPARRRAPKSGTRQTSFVHRPELHVLDQRIVTCPTSTPAGSYTCAAQAMQGSKLCIVRNTSKGWSARAS